MPKTLSLVSILVILASCASLPDPQLMNGGRVVDRDYKVEKYLVTYSGERIHLVIDQGRLAIMERDQSPRTLLYYHNSEKEDRDYFLTWLSGGKGAIEVIVPKDRTLPAEFYNYRPGYYEITNIDGKANLVPLGYKPQGYKLKPIKHY